jgi:hypothetical protein
VHTKRKDMAVSINTKQTTLKARYGAIGSRPSWSSWFETVLGHQGEPQGDHRQDKPRATLRPATKMRRNGAKCTKLGDYSVQRD